VITFAFLIVFSPSLFGQAPANQQSPTQVPTPPAGAATPEKPAPCPPFAEDWIPIRSTIEARVTGLMESNRLKPGKKLWVNSVFEMDLPECRMAAGAPVYGAVTAASSSKNPSGSELALSFDAADCGQHTHQSMKLVVVGVIGPPEVESRGHNAAPTEIQGGSRQISDTAANTSGYDANLRAALPSTVQPGYVAGFRNLRLDPQGGPQCSAKLVSTDRNLVLTPGTVLLLAVPAKIDTSH
jgi:hypothetical protein